MEQVMNFVKPELLVLVPALYVLGAMLKNAATCKDEHIPAVLGAVGVALVALWMLSTEAADRKIICCICFTNHFSFKTICYIVLSKFIFI